MDDNINHHLNKIDVSSSVDCKAFYQMMKNTHEERLNALSFCKDVLRFDIEASEASNPGHAKILQKEFGLLESESFVEAIVFDRTEEDIKNKCKGTRPGQVAARMSEEGEPFQGELFPCNYFVLYCPYADCDYESHFKTGKELIEHLELKHLYSINNSNAVLPFLDRYLKALDDRQSFSGERKLGEDEDKSIREKLQKEKLQEMLDFQERERTGIHKKPRQCLFCLEYSPTLKDLFSHMYRSHGFNIGLLDNLVMVEDFLKTLETILMKNVCIYCHNVFRSAGCLRKHMKNKRHFKIDSKNHFYDKYYIVNYVKCGALGNDSEREEKEAAGEENDENDWDDLVDTVDHRTTCLFCDKVFEEPSHELTEHIKKCHNFDLEALRQEYNNESFYEYIKVITYIRHHMKELLCPFCESEYETQTELEDHLEKEGHCKVPEKKLWDQPQYYFPVFDDDPLLFDFGDSSDD